MSLDPAKLADLPARSTRIAYTRSDARVYGLATGFGSDPLAEHELAFVTAARAPATASTFATVLATSGADAFDQLDLDHPALALHLEQRLLVYSPLPAEGEVILEAAPPRVEDRGEGRGALVHITVVGRDPGSRRALFETRYVSLARGDGGFGGPPPADNDRLAAIPDRDPDLVTQVSTRPEQALLYALTGDDNPIHTCPAAARSAGFDRPILHGLCSFGIAERVLLGRGADRRYLAQLNARFTAPVFPGEALRIEQWIDGDNISMRMTTHDRRTIVLDRGHARLAART